MFKNQDLVFAEQHYGIVLPGVMDFTTSDAYRAAAALAMDAQVPLVSNGNAGIPAALSMYIDPKVIEVLTAPNNAAKIVGDEQKRGDWVTDTMAFPVVQHTGEVSAYGDYNENGSSGASAAFPQRQSYHYQTFVRYGERELERADLAKLNWAQQLNVSAAMTLAKFQNTSYFYGIAGLQNYGLLNDPNLGASLTPGGKAANSGASGPWMSGNAFNATALEVYADVQMLFTQLVAQTNGLVTLDSPLVLAMAPTSEVALTLTNQFNVNVYDMLKKVYKNLRIETAPQYANASGGNLVQLICEEIEGQRTAMCSFTEKMRNHRVVLDSSSFKQKKSQGTWGTVVFQPMAIASMIGV